MDDVGRTQEKRNVKGVLSVANRKSFIKSPVWLICFKHVWGGGGGGVWGLIEMESQELMGGQMVSVIDP